MLLAKEVFAKYEFDGRCVAGGGRRVGKGGEGALGGHKKVEQRLSQAKVAVA